MEELKSNNKRIYVLSVMILVLFIALIVKLVSIHIFEGEELRAYAQSVSIKIDEVQARRGNIYSSDGSLLASSIPKYDVFIDPCASDDEDFNKYIGGLSDSLSVLIGGKTGEQYERMFRTARANKRRYIPLAKRLSFVEYARLKRFPLFNLGRNKGGMVIEQKMSRVHPMGEIASRTIGYERVNADGSINRKGVEAAYSKYLTGKNGKRRVQKITNSLWKPIADENFIEPVDGLDVVTTIDVYIQDIAHHALMNSLEKYGAEHGCVVVMDVKTGYIRAIANLGYYAPENKYTETINYAVVNYGDPGSTFKLASYLALLDLNKVDTSMVYDTHNGVVRFANNYVADSRKGGYGKISLGRGFEVSSNTVVTQAVNEHFKDNPLEFINKLESFGFNQKSGVDLIGEPSSYIPVPGDKNWSKIALPWMSYGYGINVTPLQILTLYNAVANDGEMVSPRIVQEIRRVNNTVEKFEKNVINPQIAKPEVIKKMRKLLEGVVKKGTGEVMYSPNFSMAGKTGTAQVNYSDDKQMYYASSFAGYFPADNPKYSCIVVIHRPTKESYYGADVAGPVFKRIAQKIYTDVPNENTVKDFKKMDEIAKKENAQKKALIQVTSGQVPNVVGMYAMDAISVLENAGMRVKVQGKGKVLRQSIEAGSQIEKQRNITIQLG